MKDNNHIIDKVFVEVSTGNMDSATSFKKLIVYLLNEYIFPELQQTLNVYNPKDRIARIKTLNLDFTIGSGDLESEFKMIGPEHFVKEIENILGMPDDEVRKGGTDGLGVIPKGKLSKETEDFEVFTEGHRGREKNGFELIPLEENRKELFFFFLENGYLPWYGNKNEINEFIKLGNWKDHINKNEFIERLTNLLRSSSTAGKRLIFQLSVEHVKMTLHKFDSSAGDVKERLLNLFENQNSDIRNDLLLFLLNVSTGGDFSKLLDSGSNLSDSINKISDILPLQKTKNDLKRVIEQGEALSDKEKTQLISTITSKEIEKELLVDSNKNVKEMDRSINQQKDEKESFIDQKDVEKEPFNNQNKEENEPFIDQYEDGLKLQNVGLIIFHPFLKQFFRTIDILDEKGKIKKESISIAVQSLHYLATENIEFFEGDLIFEKFLCGIPITMPVERENLLSEKIEYESKQLLIEVINQWAALRSSSPQDLREMFIRRNGKLNREGSNYRLIMERKAQDVLLEKLNWNISLVKTPWVKELIFVDW